MINFNWYQFSALSTAQIYGILKLRAEVFIVEQKCPYLDPDGLDISAIHLLGTEKSLLVAYARVFVPNEIENDVVFGRIVTDKYSRNKGYGKKLIQEILRYAEYNFKNTNIRCSAQNHLRGFYEAFGFEAVSHVYDEDGIPHISMQKSL